MTILFLVTTVLFNWIFSSVGYSQNNWDYLHQDEWDQTWSEGMQSPININSPYSNKVSVTWDDMAFDYWEVDNSYFVHTGNNLMLYGDFGKLKYNGK